MNNLRDMPNPSGADVEVYVNQRLAAGGSWKAQDYDFKAEPANIYPGPGWEYVGLGSVGIHVIIVWRMSRAQQTAMNIQPAVPTVRP